MSGLWEDLRQDLWYAVRSLARTREDPHPECFTCRQWTRAFTHEIAMPRSQADNEHLSINEREVVRELLNSHERARSDLVLAIAGQLQDN